MEENFRDWLHKQSKEHFVQITAIFRLKEH